MSYAERTARASEVLALAQIIKEEEGLDDNAAYALAERELDTVREIEATDGPFSVTPTTHGLLVRKGAYWLHLDLRQLEQVFKVGRRCLTTHRRDLKIERRRVIVRGGR